MVLDTLGNIGTIYDSQGDFVKSEEHLFKSLKINEELNNKGAITHTLSNIDYFHENQEIYNKELGYSNKALELESY